MSEEARGCEVRAALLILQDVMIQREQARKPNVYGKTSSRRDGLDCLNFFLDLINEVAGYSAKHYEEPSVEPEDLIKKYRAEYQSL
jgi:hypothetical protein